MSGSADEQLFHARDSYSSAALLACLVLTGQIVALVAFGSGRQAVPVEVRFALCIVAFCAVGYLVATRRRPHEQAAWAVCAILIAPFLLLAPWAAVRWGHIGGPWEAFFLPQIAMISLGLTVPRSPSLGMTTCST